MTVLKWVLAGALGYVALAGVLLWLDGAVCFAFVVGGFLLFSPTVTTATVLLVLHKLRRFLDHTDTHPASVRGRVPTVAAGTVVIWTLTLLVGGPLSAPLVLLCSPLVFLPFGVLAATGHPARWLFPPVVALGVLVAAVLFSQQVGLLVVSPAMLTVAMVGSRLLGLPLFLLGRDLAEETGPAAASQV